MSRTEHQANIALSASRLPDWTEYCARQVAHYQRIDNAVIDKLLLDYEATESLEVRFAKHLSKLYCNL